MLNLSTKFCRPCPYIVSNNLTPIFDKESLHFDEKTKTYYTPLTSPGQIDKNLLAKITHKEHKDIFSKVQSTKSIQSIDEQTSILDMNYLKKFDKVCLFQLIMIYE